jgi:gamma-glutamylcysteine synthetase
MHLFTVNAASHVHVSVSQDEAVPVVNALNGLAGAQIALMADSAVWQGGVDPDYLSPAEIFWDWWMKDMPQRVGVPPRPYESLTDYVDLVAQFPPVFVNRDEGPLTLEQYASFREYFLDRPATGRDLSGQEVSLEPRAEDLDLHSTCYWHNARISRYYTVENRVYDQQPPEDLILPSALTLGLVEAAEAAGEIVRSHEWGDLVQSRRAACAQALQAKVGEMALSDLAGDMLAAANQGLKSRGRGEEVFLEPLADRLSRGETPAQQAKAVFQQGGASALVEKRGV